MEFGKHLGKGIWAFADKALPAFYGVAYIFLVVRVLPEREFGVWGIIWALYILLSTLCNTLAFLPLTKFAAESDEYGKFVSASLFVGFLFYAVISAGLVACKGYLIPLLDADKTQSLYALWNYVPLLLFATLFRTMALALLQARYAVNKIFWIDAVYFIGTVFLILGARYMHHLSTANDLIILNLIGFTCSSLLSIVMIVRFMPKNIAFKWADVRTLLQFGKYLFGSNAIYALFAQLDVFFVSSYAGVLGVAIYNVAKIFNRIFDMLTQVLQMFLLPFSSKAHAQGDHAKLVATAEKAICFSTLLMLPVLLAMVLVPEQILLLLYKGKYLDAAPIMRVFCLLALIVPWNGVVSNFLVGFGKVKQGFYMGFILLGLGLFSYRILTPALGILGTSIGYVLALGITTLVLCIYMNQFLPLRITSIAMRVTDAWEFVRRKAFSR